MATDDEPEDLIGSEWRRRSGRGDRGVQHLSVVGVSETFVDEQNRPLLQIAYRRHGMTGWRGVEYLRANYRLVASRG